VQADTGAFGVHTKRTSIWILGFGSLGFAAILPSASAKPTPSATANQSPDMSEKVTFHNVATGEVEDEDHIPLGTTLFKASDGRTLEVLYEDFGSPAKARDYLENRLARAERVLARENKLDAKGKVIGERAEILLRLSKQEVWHAILWTDGVKFHEIISSSLDDLLELERVYRY
jgi:hypothetical protein